VYNSSKFKGKINDDSLMIGQDSSNLLKDS